MKNIQTQIIKRKGEKSKAGVECSTLMALYHKTDKKKELLKWFAGKKKGNGRIDYT